MSEKSGGDRVTTRFSEKKELSATSVAGGGRGLGRCVWGGWDLRRGRGRAAGSGPGVAGKGTLRRTEVLGAVVGGTTLG